METYQTPILKSTQVMFKNINKNLNKFIKNSKFSGSESALHIRKPDSSTKNRVNNKKVLNCTETKLKSTKYFSQKIQNFKIPEVSHTKFLKNNECKTNLSTNDGYLVHTFSIPNGFVNIRHREMSSKKLADRSFIVNPNLRPGRRGLIGYKLYNSLKQIKKPKAVVPTQTKLNNNLLSLSALP